MEAQSHADEIPELTPDQFRRWEESLRRDTQLLTARAGRSPREALSTMIAESLLDRARQLQADARSHAAEIRLVDALLTVNEALAAV
jgi:hypothetical protein